MPAHFAAATLLFKYKKAKEDSALERLRTLQQTTSEERAKADKGYSEREREAAQRAAARAKREAEDSYRGVWASRDPSSKPSTAPTVVPSHAPTVPPATEVLRLTLLDHSGINGTTLATTLVSDLGMARPSTGTHTTTNERPRAYSGVYQGRDGLGYHAATIAAVNVTARAPRPLAAKPAAMPAVEPDMLPGVPTRYRRGLTHSMCRWHHHVGMAVVAGQIPGPAGGAAEEPESDTEGEWY